MTRPRLLLLGALLIGGLGLLVASLSGTHFREGSLSWGAPPEGAPGGAAHFGEPTALLDILLAIVLVLFGVYVIVHIATPEGRRRILRQMLRLAVVLLVLFLARDLLQRREGAELTPEGGPPAALPWSLPAGGEGTVAGSAPPAVPGWVVSLAAAVLAGGIALWLWRRWRVPPPGELDEIRAALDEASADLSAGVSVADVVVRCWAQMVAIASRRMKDATAPQLTARELAERLVALGFREEAVRVLTKLFEEVRYGHKDSESRRAEALAALAAIRQAHG